MCLCLWADLASSVMALWMVERAAAMGPLLRSTSPYLDSTPLA